MTIWDKHPNYTDAELRHLVKSAAMALYDTADNQDQLDPEVFEISPHALAKELAQDLKAAHPHLHTEHVEQLLSDGTAARTASVAALGEIRKHPLLAARVADIYADQQSKMVGIEMLLAGALLVLAVRVKSFSLSGKGLQVDFYESSEAVKDFIVKLVSAKTGLS